MVKKEAELDEVADGIATLDLKSSAASASTPAPAEDLKPASSDAAEKTDTRELKDIVKAAFDSILSREMRWLRGLSLKHQKRLDQGATGPQFPAHHLTMAGEYGMCLLGLKPCVVIDHGNWDEAQYGEETYAKKHHDAVVKPWFDEFGLERFGFRLITKLTSCAAPPEIPHHPGFKGGSLFYNAEAPEARLVESVFLSGKDQVPNVVLGKAFGYPGGQQGPLVSNIQYTPVIDKPWRRPDAPNESLCCICLLEYSATPADTRKVGRHYRAMAAAFESQFGIKVSLDLQHCDKWHNKEVAEVLVEAFGDVDRLLTAIEAKEILWWKWLYERRHTILPMVDRMASRR